MPNGSDLDVRPAYGHALIDQRTKHPRAVAAVAALLLVALTMLTGVSATPARAAEPAASTAAVEPAAVTAAASTWRLTCTWGVETLVVKELTQCKGGSVVVTEILSPGNERTRGTINMTKTMAELGAAESFAALWQRCEGNFICNLVAGTAVTYVAGKFKALWKAVRG